MRSLSILAMACAVLLLAQGCAPVKAWERGNLAKPEMALVTDPMHATINSHIYHSKEGASAIAAGSGGGCGCN